MKATKAEAIRRAREIRAELLTLISILEAPGIPEQVAARIATRVFELSRSLETVVHRVVRRER